MPKIGNCKILGHPILQGRQLNIDSLTSILRMYLIRQTAIVGKLQVSVLVRGNVEHHHCPLRPLVHV